MRKLILPAVVLVMLATTAVGCSGQDDLPPDYSALMREVGARYTDMYVAAQQDKWEYAEYQAKKIRLLVEKSAALNPAATSDTNDFLNGSYPAILDAISSKDKEQFGAAYGKFNSYCNACHVAQNVGYLELTIPTVSDSPILEGGAPAEGGEGGDSGGDAGGGGLDKAAVEKTCTDCHDTERIKAAAYDEAGWLANVGRMKAKGAPVDDEAAIAKFLADSEGLKKDAAGGGGEAGGGAEGGGGGGSVDKAAVEKTCTDCHDTERIKAAAYDEAGWLANVGRMKAKGAPVDDDAAYAKFLTDSEGLKK